MNSEAASAYVRCCALYYALPPGERLAVAGQWLGRNAETGQAHALRITAKPRLYGFHGTLKPPMALSSGASERDLLAAVGSFAASRRSCPRPLIWVRPTAFTEMTKGSLHQRGAL